MMRLVLSTMVMVALALPAVAVPAAGKAALPARSATTTTPAKKPTVKKDPDASLPAFQALKAEVEALRKDPERRKFRHNYEKLIVRLQAAANTYAPGERADDCAFVAAQLLEELHSVSVMPADRQAAVLAFSSMAERFSSSSLADDALIAAARLTDDVEAGRRHVDAVLAMKGADMKAAAADLKKTRFTDDAVAAAVAARKLAAKARVAEKTDRTEKTDKNPKPVRSDDGHDHDDDNAAVAAPTKVEDRSALTVTVPLPRKDLPFLSAPTDAATDTAPLLSSMLLRTDTANVTMRPVAVLPNRPAPGTASRKVIVIRHERTDSESLVRLRISGEVGVLRGEVPGDALGVGRRIFYDVAPAKLGQRNIVPIEVHDGTIARVRAGQYDVDVVRLVIELEGPKEPVLSVTKKPFELVLTSPLVLPKADVVAGVAHVEVKKAAAPAAPDAKEVRTRIADGLGEGVSISQQLGLKVHRVVLDAGHGGHDVGAIGPSGVREKDITLLIAKKVKEKLNAEMPDVEVIMTRDDDRTLALQDRTNIANSAAADLFISIHCNASPSRRVRGVETYYLNTTHDRYSMRLAARENSELGEGSISDLDFILADLAMKSNVDDSVRLGRSVQRGVVQKLRQNWTDVPDLGLKHALFFVLMGNKMPSILVETSFLSNKTEEKNLSKDEYQAAVADGIVAGVRGFVDDRQAFFRSDH